MALKKISFQTRPEDAGKRLDQVLADRLPEKLGEKLGDKLGGVISKGKARKLIVAGAVYLNGRRLRIASKALLANAKVDVFVDDLKLAEGGPSRDQVFRMSAGDILFEDEFLIAVNKPPGLPTQPTLDEARDNLFAAVKKFLTEREKDPQAYVGLHHRLDRDTSGVVLFTKKTEVNAGVSELFSKHLAVKTYNAISLARPGGGAQEWAIHNYLGKDRSSGGKRAQFTAVKNGGDLAHTDFRLLEEFRGSAWVEAKPKTGRTHQIRVHLSEYGMPILGDEVYSTPASRELSEKYAIPRLMLHAASLTFPHPIHNNQISISSPLPKDFLRCVQSLRAFQKNRDS